MSTPFEFDLGLYQGRIPVSDAPGGLYVYELGHALRHEGELVVGDYHEIEQSFVLSAASRILRVSIRTKPPRTLPAGRRWLLTAALNSVVRASRYIEKTRRDITLVDFAIPLINANTPPTPNTVAYRLEVVL